MSATPTIFIVDDDDAVRSALSLLVAAYGWQPRAFASGEEFLQCYQADTPSCLLLDLQMPGMSGTELQETLLDRAIDVPVIVLTAYADHPLAESAKRAGARAIIGKPFRDEELLAEIKRALNDRR